MYQNHFFLSPSKKERERERSLVGTWCEIRLHNGDNIGYSLIIFKAMFVVEEGERIFNFSTKKKVHIRVFLE